MGAELWITLASALIGGGELRQNLDDIAKLASARRGTEALASKSNTPIGITANAAPYVAGVVFSPATAATVAVLQYSTGRLLASPAFTRWLARMPKTEIGMRSHLARLDNIARISPVLAEDIARMKAGLSEPVVPRLAADPQAEGEDDER